MLDADLAAATKTGMFRKAYPGRHFDCGIAESNMMGVAAGLSTMGYVPFVSSFAMFAAGRAFEQIRNSIGYPHLNVKIGATHGGISVGEDGASHQCCEDFALMRSIPGMTVICPADDVEARAAVRAAYEMQGPVYLRFGRLAVPVFHDEANYHFELGKGEQITEGDDIAIVATGLMVNEARIAAEQLAAEGIHARVINIHTIKPLDEDIILKAAKECGKIVTAEEHNVIGGLGEAVCAVLREVPTPSAVWASGSNAPARPGICSSCMVALPSQTKEMWASKNLLSGRLCGLLVFFYIRGDGGILAPSNTTIHSYGGKKYGSHQYYQRKLLNPRSCWRQARPAGFLGRPGAACRMLSPLVDEVAEERGDIKVGKVSVDEQPELAGQFDVA